MDMDALGRRIADFQDTIAFFEAAGKSNKEVEIRYASRVKGLYNGLKNYQGKLEGLQKFGLIGKKTAQEKTFLDWAAASPKNYAGTVDALAAFSRKMKHSPRGAPGSTPSRAGRLFSARP